MDTLLGNSKIQHSVWEDPSRIKASGINQHTISQVQNTLHRHWLTKAKTWYPKIRSWKVIKPVFLSNITNLFLIKLEESPLPKCSIVKSLHDIVNGKQRLSKKNKKQYNNQACTAVAAESTLQNTVTPFQGNDKRKHLTSRLLWSGILNKYLTCHHP